MSDTPTRFRTLEDACRYLAAQGYQCSVFKLSRDHTRRGKVNRDAEGFFTQSSLDAYGRAHCKITGLGETVDQKMARLAREKQEAETRQAVAQADRRETQRDRERGLLIPIEAAHRERALLMGLFWSLAENLARTWPTRAVALGAPAERQPELAADLSRELADMKRKLYAQYQRGEPVLVSRTARPEPDPQAEAS